MTTPVQDIISPWIERYRVIWILQNNSEALRLNVALWSVLFITNLIDLGVTYTAFQYGAVEANPFMAFLCTKFGNIALAFYKGLSMGILLFILPFVKKGMQKLLAVVCGIYILLVVSHLVRFLA